MQGLRCFYSMIFDRTAESTAVNQSTNMPALSTLEVEASPSDHLSNYTAQPLVGTSQQLKPRQCSGTRICQQNGCITRPYFNLPGEPKGAYCSLHKQLGMINVITKPCLHSGCRKSPNFNFKGHSPGLYCGDHKHALMINVKTKRCEREGCEKQPTFNIEGTTARRFCSAHKEDGMIQIHSLQCEHEGCKKWPAFNVEGSKEGSLCKSHKERGMVNVVARLCEKDGCNTQASYGDETQSIRRFCFAHKLSGMVFKKHKKIMLLWVRKASTGTPVYNKSHGYPFTLLNPCQPSFCHAAHTMCRAGVMHRET